MQIVVDALESRQRAAAEVHSLENMKAEADGRLKEKLQELAAVETPSGEAPAIEMQPRAIEARPRMRAPSPRVAVHKDGGGRTPAATAAW